MDTSKNTGKDTITIDSAKAEVLAALSQKYEKTFECVACEKPSLINGEYTFCLVETGFEYEGYGFKAYYNPNSETKISDGYFGIIVRKEMSSILLDTEFAKEAKVFVKMSNTSFDNELNTLSTVKDALEIYKSLRVYYYVFLPENSEYDVDTLVNKMSGNAVGGMINYFEVPHDVYLQLSYNNYIEVERNISRGTIISQNEGSIDF